MAFLKRLFVEFLEPLIVRLINAVYPKSTTVRIAERIDGLHTQSVNGCDLHFRVNNTVSLWRARSLLSKEPETIAWLDEMSSDDVLWDIGANIGQYSLYAAKVVGARVYAFEPDALNYAALNRNIEINGLEDHVLALCVALASDFGVNRLHIPNFETGGALSMIGARSPYVEEERRPFRQGAVRVTLDRLLDEVTVDPPTRIKLDVDGLEEEILVGSDDAGNPARRVLGHRELESILVELDASRDGEGRVRTALEEAGFEFRSRFSTNTSVADLSEQYNCIFDRDPEGSR